MQQNHHDLVHDFFHTFSRVIIVLPIIIVVFSVILAISKSDSVLREKKVISTINQVNPTPVLQKKNSINLKGPSACLLQTKEASWSAFIQNKMIHATLNDNKKTTYYLINNDCLYTWEKNNNIGGKTCGIGQYLSLGEQLLNSGLMNQSNISLPIPVQYKDILQVVSSCKPSKTIPLNQFELPKDVVFKSVTK